MEEQKEIRPKLDELLHTLQRIQKQADADGGATYDRMAENIRSRAAEGLIEEAIGYVPNEQENIARMDRPVHRKAKRRK